MLKKILIISLAIIALTSIKANAQYLCGSTGYIYRNQGFCNANCSLNGSAAPCGTLTPSTSTTSACPSGYEGFVFDPNNNMTYALNTSNQFWTYFQNQDSSSQSLILITGSDINGIGQSILNYYNIPDAWIGLYNPQMSTDYNTVNPDRSYSLADGSSLSYANWASGQPNNALPDQDLSLLPKSEYGQHWIEMENNGTWNDIGYNYTYLASQNYAPYLPALVQFNNQLSCVSGTQPSTPLTTGQQTNLANKYCSGNTANCYLCSNGTSLAQCQSGSTFPSGSAEICPNSKTQCNKETAAPTCPSGTTYNSSTGQCVTTTAVSPTCPSGSAYSNGSCIAQPECPYNYTYNSSTEECTVTNITGDSCPSGYTMQSNGTCLSTSTSTPICPSGYTYSNGLCSEQVTSTQTTSATCPSGYSYNSGSGECEEVTLSCPTQTMGCGGYSDNLPSNAGCKCATSSSEKFDNYYYAYRVSIYHYAAPSCPSGYTYAGNYNCSAAVTSTKTVEPICPSGETYNSNTWLCDSNSTTAPSCPGGYTLSNNECVSTSNTAPICPSGTSFSNNECLSSATCPGGYTLTNNECVNNQYSTPNVCPTGETLQPSSLNLSTGTATWTVQNSNYNNGQPFNAPVSSSGVTCITSIPSGSQIISAASGYIPNGEYIYQTTFNSTATGTLTINITADDFANVYLNGTEIGSTDNNSGNSSCWNLTSSTSDYTYSGSVISGENTLTIDAYNNDSNAAYNNGGGSPNPGGIAASVTVNNPSCVSYSCPLGNNDTCVNTGSGYYCSSYPCSNYNNNPSYTLNNPNINANNPTNNGQTNSAGECMGQIYIFSGKAFQCRDPGIQTGWGGGCCTADKTWFGLSNCNSQEKLLAQQRAADNCTMVGTYCAESFLGYCLQTDQTWCCFPSLLANIIQQQTRAAQGLPISGWGSAQSPNCIGYTPQQFQAINFSKINLSAFYNSIMQQTSSEISGAATNAVNKFQQSLSGE
ncbi:MAG: conjugal transfer protein TraN [bacterium]